MLSQPLIVIADTSVLVNFLRVDRTDLLGQLSASVVIADHVEAEVTDHYPEQVARLQAGVAQGHFGVTALTAPAELALFAQLIGSGRLGSGECAAITCAIIRGHSLAIDDRKAQREALRVAGSLQILRTEDLVVMMIRENLLSVAEADGIKAMWEAQHRFRLRFTSFADIL